MVGGRCFRGHRPRPASDAAIGRRAKRRAFGGYLRRPNHAFDPESGARAGYDGHKRKKGSKVHMAVDTLGHLLAMHVTPANEQERGQVEELAKSVQEVTDNNVELAFVDQGFTGEEPAQAAQKHGITLEVVRLPEAKRGFVLLPRRWVVERSLGWMARFRRLAKDYERLTATLVGMHFVAFVCLLLHRAIPLLVGGS